MTDVFYSWKFVSGPIASVLELQVENSQSDQLGGPWKQLRQLPGHLCARRAFQDGSQQSGGVTSSTASLGASYAGPVLPIPRATCPCPWGLQGSGGGKTQEPLGKAECSERSEELCGRGGQETVSRR